MKRVRMFMPFFLVLVLVVGCAGWNTLNEDERARVTISLLQDQVSTLRENGVSWALNLPQDTPEQLAQKRIILKKLHSEVLPAVKVADETIIDVAKEVQLGKIDRKAAQRLIMPFINRVAVLLANLGYIPQ